MITPNNSFTIFIVPNLDAAKSYYTRYFSFDIAFENEWYLHLVSRSGIEVGFMLPDQPTQPDIFHGAYSGSGVIFSFEVEDAEAAYTEAKQHQLDVVHELRSEDWGQYHFCLKDPNGVYLDIVQAIEPTEEYQVGYTDQ